jgi:hypothetical protein
MKWLNLIVQVQAIVPIVGFAFEDEHYEIRIFGIATSMEKSSRALLISELSFVLEIIYPCLRVAQSTSLVTNS